MGPASMMDPQLCSSSYISVEMVADRVAALGRGTHLSKIDVHCKELFRFTVMTNTYEECPGRTSDISMPLFYLAFKVPQ